MVQEQLEKEKASLENDDETDSLTSVSDHKPAVLPWGRRRASKLKPSIPVAATSGFNRHSSLKMLAKQRSRNRGGGTHNRSMPTSLQPVQALPY